MAGGGHLVVTGASSGIGHAIARRALAEGWRVTGVSRRGDGPSHESYVGVSCDLMDASATAKCIEGVAPPDALVHAAGFMTTARLAETDPADGERMWRIHVGAVTQMASALAPRMPNGSRIVLIGSRVAAGAAGRSQYAAVKAAEVALARSWAAELIDRQITVNVVAPGATDTPMLQSPSRRSSAPRVPPLGRLVRPEEVAGAVAFLLSADAAAITGQTLVICGGASL